jgi:CHAD domain-containing protein
VSGKSKLKARQAIAELRKDDNIAPATWRLSNLAGMPALTFEATRPPIGLVRRGNLHMSRSPRSAGKTAIPAESAQPRRRGEAMPRLNAMMACDTAFRTIARRSLSDLTANHPATCQGDPEALHHMRVALTRLRTAILFFSPMVSDLKRTQLRHELKWLNRHLGGVRDIDVAVERLQAIGKTRPQPARYYRSWNKKRAESHRLLARALRSTRYRRLVKSASDWIEIGPWTVKAGAQAAKERAAPIAEYSADKLARWRAKLLKKSRKLAKMDVGKRHRLRLLNKKLSYSTEFFQDLFAEEKLATQFAGLKHLRRAQRSLGQLNDDANGDAMAVALQRSGVPAPLRFLSPKHQKRLLRTAAAAYRKLEALKPI